MSDSDLLFRSAGELAALIRDGEVSPRELAELSLRRIEALDDQINAFVDVDAERTLAEADAVRPGDQPFAGVPIAIKANVPVEGRLMDYASAFMGAHRPDHDAFLVRRLKEAGFVITGMTNLPEFGILPTTEPRLHGPTRNPYDTERTPGGSSGGSAAAVAAGMVPLAHGNDGGGSIRIPAACCGLVGLKPARGRVSRGPDLGESPLTADGVLTRSVADTAQLLDVLAGYEAGDATWAARPRESYTRTVQKDPGRLRIAFTTENSLGAAVDPECAGAVQQAAELLAELGHDVEEATPPLPGPEAKEIFKLVFGAHISLGILHGQLLSGREPTTQDVEPLSLAFRDLSGALPSFGYLAALTQLHAISRTVIGFFAHYDLLLGPVLAQRPLLIGELDGCNEEDPLAALDRSGDFVPYPALFNITGQPAISVPVRMGPDGLPTCVQLAAKPICEETLLQVARQMEVANPWAAWRPEVAATA